MFFVNTVKRKYGRQVSSWVKSLLKTAIKMAKAKNRLKFMLNCRRCKLVPNCLNYKLSLNLVNPVSVAKLNKLVHKQKIKLISVTIQDTKRTLQRLKKTKQYLKRKVEETTSVEDWQYVLQMVEKSARNTYTKTKTVETRKLEALKMEKVRSQHRNREWIENTTMEELPDFVERTLLLGPNFNIQNRRTIPYVRFVADVETAIKRKPEAEEIRGEVSTIMSNYVNYQRQPKTKENEWILKEIIRTRKFLNEHPDLYVTRADKGNKTVVLSATEYREKMAEMVSDTNTYKPLNENPTNRTLKKLNTIIEEWWKDEILGNVVGKTQYHVRNSFDFANEISHVVVPDGCIMYSLDVVSLYTNVPVEKVYQLVEAKWKEIQEYTTISWDRVKHAMKTVLEASFFQYDGKFYCQTTGVPMGSPLSPVVANLIMEKVEQEAITQLEEKNITLSIYRRYVDDCFIVGRREDVEKVVEQFNVIDEKLQFTVEEEMDEALRFLDLTLSRSGERIRKMWFPKQKDGRYLDYHSESPHTHKVNTMIALIDRALKLTDPDRRRGESIGMNEEKKEESKKYVSIPYIPGLSEKVSKTLKQHEITASFKPCDKVKNTVFTKLKDAIPPMKQTNVVYSIPCGACEEKEYIGQTSQTLDKRIAQHRNSIRTKASATGLTQHAVENGHHFDFSRTRILERIDNYASRLTAEVIHIKVKKDTTVNLQRDVDGFSNTYNNLINKLKDEQQRTERRHREVG
ncbi:uncharacterized protein LOC134291055 [Aedes albopictus]|uniref:Reverse transcriptase domain-containing protein n=1 Tax=Aedes albopictus TaxID=7160 RepID=A0ABM1ZQE9_AEDAL